MSSCQGLGGRGMGSDCLMHTQFLSGWWKCSKLDCVDGCTTVNMLKATEALTLNDWIVCYVYYVSIKMLQKRKKERKEGREERMVVFLWKNLFYGHGDITIAFPFLHWQLGSSKPNVSLIKHSGSSRTFCLFTSP